MPEIIFSKKELQIYFYFGPNFVFWRSALGRFSQGFFVVVQLWCQFLI